ncbi:hypothetical protein L3X38_019514 [Prunus dulcis]|uniref:Protein kinase domain-containing protein n=1 Tax=Prunus dulcis TaxID=3755 RepID=A0AAD4ZBT1_PRUDU|nr:hypothetical protein L3X38_019514 [Prunus dulcis]
MTSKFMAALMSPPKEKIKPNDTSIEFVLACHDNISQSVSWNAKAKSICNHVNSEGRNKVYKKERGSSSNILTWKDRLQIAIDAAQGLEYLHYGCKPPMIHRDVKLTNILLNENFQAKLSDFGLSRTFPSNDDTHILTVVAGTPGYHPLIGAFKSNIRN